jgi:hypothetical protein
MHIDIEGVRFDTRDRMIRESIRWGLQAEMAQTLNQRERPSAEIKDFFAEVCEAINFRRSLRVTAAQANLAAHALDTTIDYDTKRLRSITEPEEYAVQSARLEVLHGAQAAMAAYADPPETVQAEAA